MFLVSKFFYSLIRDWKPCTSVSPEISFHVTGRSWTYCSEWTMTVVKAGQLVQSKVVASVVRNIQRKFCGRWSGCICNTSSASGPPAGFTIIDLAQEKQSINSVYLYVAPRAKPVNPQSSRNVLKRAENVLRVLVDIYHGSHLPHVTYLRWSVYLMCTQFVICITSPWCHRVRCICLGRVCY